MNYILLLTSLIAGIFTIFAPCSLMIIPVIASSSTRGISRSVTVITSMAFGIFIATLLLKGSTSLLFVPQSTWDMISGILFILIGIIFVFPQVWYTLDLKFGFSRLSQSWFQSGNNSQSTIGDICMGLALGPIFSSCSPTYLLIVATILPVSLFEGVLYIVAYIVGLIIPSFILAYAGSHLFATRLARYNNQVKRIAGIFILVVGIMVATGLYKAIETYVVSNSLVVGLEVEQWLMHYTNR